MDPAKSDGAGQPSAAVTAREASVESGLFPLGLHPGASEPQAVFTLGLGGITVFQGI